MKTLANEKDRADLIARLRKIRPDTPRRWGRMTAPQMIMHLSDAFLGLLGERQLPAELALPSSGKPRRRAPIRRAFRKWYAITSPLPWPHGVRTRPEVDAEKGGTPPGDFATDLAKLEELCVRFAGPAAASRRPVHYLFGTLTEAEWCRWGWRHVNHHLTQFGL
jgi:hypothetical protein